MDFNIISVIFYGMLLLAVGSIPARWIQFNSKSESFLLNLFFAQLTTLLVIVSFYAIIVSSFKTIFLLVPFIIGAYIYSQKSNMAIQTTASFVKKIVPVFVLLIVVFVFTFIYIIPKTVEADVIYYSKVSSFLMTNGIENHFHYYNQLLKTDVGLMPYHYFELWFNALVSFTSHFTSLVSLKYIVYPYLITVCIIGIVGLYEHFNKTKSSPLVLFLVFILSTLFAFLGDKLSIHCSGWELIFSVWLRPNFILNYIVIIVLLSAIYEDNYRLLMIAVILACLLSVTLIPAILPSVFLYFCFLLWQKKITFLEALKNGVLAVTFLLLYFFFYKLNQGNLAFIESKPIAEIILYSFKIWKATLGAFLNIVIRCLIFVPLFYVLVKKKFLPKEIIIFFVIIVITSVGTFQLLSQLDNSYQIPHLSFCLMATLMIITVLFFITKINYTYQVGIIISLFFLSLYLNLKEFIPLKNGFDNRAFFVTKNGLDNDFAKLISTKLNTPNSLYGYYIDEKKLKKIQYRYRTEITLQPLLELAYYTNNNNMVCLNSKNQMLNGSGTGKEILEVWYQTFPYFSIHSNPFEYVTFKNINGLLLSKNAVYELKNNLHLIKENKLNIHNDANWILATR